MTNIKTTRPIALVTGAGRRQGIGAATCMALAEKAHDIAFTHWQVYDRQMDYSDEGGPPALEADLERLGARVWQAEVDLSDPTAPAKLLDEVTASLGFPTVLVNNAAHSTSEGYETLDAATLDAHYAVNLRGTALLSAEFARRWPGGEGGRIINLTSGQSLGPMPTELAYIATKGAIEAFTVSLSAGVASLGITVNAVNPGPTDTGWMSEDLKAFLLTKFPLGRLGQPEDVARLIAFLASPDAKWITGQVIHSEGGFQRH
jgi:3-oxoacyl-[acyl-carrier protein] reductase